MTLKLLHLSDIHFQHYENDNILDLDDDLRNEIEHDLDTLIKSLGKIDIILIGGDISFSGKEEEYIKASQWLEKICDIIHCEKENVLTVPGNHDINRDSVDELHYSAHDKLKRTIPAHIDKELGKYIDNTQTWSYLLSPLTNYHQFSQKFSSVPDDNDLFWEKNFPLDNHTIRIRGLNSTIVSDKNDNFHSSKMVLGSHQIKLKREKGVIYITLCHHPPQWFYDVDNIENTLNNRSRIQLFGHKHIFSSLRVEDFLRITAGAVHPEKDESNWEPRYNLIELSITETHTCKLLNVKLWKRIWKKQKQIFNCDYSEDGKLYEEFNLKLDPVESNSAETTHLIPEVTNMPEPMKVNTPDHRLNEIEVINPALPNPKRKLAYLFLGLPYPKRIEIASRLHLIEEDDRNLTDFQKSQVCFIRASEKMLLANLWDEVILNIPEYKETLNPFK